jgi:glycogen debranching enzyme
MIAAGLARYGYKPLASRVFDAMLSASGFMELHRLPELFCGFDRRVGEGPTLYPVACSPQAWAAGSVFLLLQSCLGLSLNAGQGQVHFERPYLPETVPHLVIRNLKLGDASLDLSLERRSGSVRIEILEKRGVVQVVVS